MSSLFVSPVTRAEDANGNPLSGATWTFYTTGSTTPAAVYGNYTLGSSLGSVVTADSGGLFVPIYLNPAIIYRAVLKNAAGAVIQDIDPYNPNAISTQITTVATRSAMAAITGMASGQGAYLTELGRGGDFIWRLGNYTAAVAADTQQGIYVASGTIATSVGCWVRNCDANTVNLTWFGADATNVSDTQNAWDGAETYLNYVRINVSGSLSGHGVINITPGTFKKSGTQRPTGMIKYQGYGNGKAGGDLCKINMTADVAAFEFYQAGDNRHPSYPTTVGADNSSIDGLAIYGYGGKDAGTNKHGIFAGCRVSITNNIVTNCSGHGCEISAAAGSGQGNANCTTVSDNRFFSNGMCGLFASGSDVNSMSIERNDTSYNGLSGIYSDTYLCVLHLANHSEANGYSDTYPSIVHYLGELYCVMEGQEVLAKTTVPGTDATIWHHFATFGPGYGRRTWVSGTTYYFAAAVYNSATLSAGALWLSQYCESGQPPAVLHFPAVRILGTFGDAPLGDYFWINQASTVAAPVAITTTAAATVSNPPTQAEVNALVAKFNTLLTDVTNARTTLASTLTSLKSATILKS